MRAIQVDLSTGKTLTMREPKRAEFSLFLRCTPSLEAIGKVVEASQQNARGVIEPVPELTPESQAPFDELLRNMADLSQEDFDALGLWDWLALVQGFGELVPANFTKAKPKK